MKLEKLSLQFALHETGQDADVLEAYERLIHDAMVGDHTLFNTAEGIERLWEISTPLLENPPPVQPYPRGAGGRPRSTTSSRRALAPALRAPLARRHRRLTQARLRGPAAPGRTPDGSRCRRAPPAASESGKVRSMTTLQVATGDGVEMAGDHGVGPRRSSSSAPRK